MGTKKCINCGEEISKERLEALPDTETCVECSTVERYISIVQGAGMAGNSKGYSIEIFDRNNPVARSYIKKRRVRSWGKGVGAQDQRSTAYWKAKKREGERKG